MGSVGHCRCPSCNGSSYRLEQKNGNHRQQCGLVSLVSIVFFFFFFFFLTQFKVVPKFINTLENHCKGTLTRVGPTSGHPQWVRRKKISMDSLRILLWGKICSNWCGFFCADFILQTSVKNPLQIRYVWTYHQCIVVISSRNLFTHMVTLCSEMLCVFVHGISSSHGTYWWEHSLSTNTIVRSVLQKSEKHNKAKAIFNFNLVFL